MDKLTKKIREELPDIIIETAFRGIKSYIEDDDWYYPEDLMETVSRVLDEQIEEAIKELCELPEFKSKIREVAEKNLSELIINKLK